VLAAGLSIGAAAALGITMAATDHSASAAPTGSTSSPAAQPSGGSGNNGFGSDPFSGSQSQQPAQQPSFSQQTPRVHTRTGGS
jgi:hypothetical protein